MQTHRPRTALQPFAPHAPNEAASTSADDYVEVAGAASYTMHPDRARLRIKLLTDALETTSAKVSTLPEFAALGRAVQAAGASGLFVDVIEGEHKSGLLGSSVSARYTLSLDCPSDALHAVVHAIEKDRHATLLSAMLLFPDDPSEHAEAVSGATRRAKASAQAVAEALEVSLDKPHRVLVTTNASDASPSAVRPAKKMSSSSSEGVYLVLRADRTVEVRVTLRYRL